MSHVRQVTLGTSGVSSSAFGQQKVVLDKSSFHMLYTYDVSKRGSKELKFDGVLDYVEQPSFTNAISHKGALKLTSGTVLNDRYQLRSLQHTRYQPNRGYLYSASIFLPDPELRGTRQFGPFIPCNGIWIELIGDGVDYVVNFVIRNHWLDDRVDITALIPDSVDLSKGNLWDIQMEWRGVGDVKVFLNLELLYHHKQIGTLDDIFLENPSLPVSVESINQGDEVEIKIGCVDVSMEGGHNDKRYYGSVSTSTNLLTVTTGQPRGTAVLCFRLPKKINYGEVVDPNTGLPDAGGTNEVGYSRDIVMDAITTFCKDESFTVVSASRGVHLPNLSALVSHATDPSLGWVQSTDSYVEYMTGGNGSLLETAFQLDYTNMRELHASRHEIDSAAIIPNPNPETTPFNVTSDSYVLVSILPDGANKSAGCNVEFSEQI